jgi:tRNA dimethylallyltransferase
MGNEVLVIAGPTAAGKSALALRLAETIGGAIVNADSMQLYAGLPILTAAPGAAARARAPHALYGVLAPQAVGTAAGWAAMAEAAIAEAEGKGLRPILVGGTGLYLRTLWGGIAAVPAIPWAVRESVRRRLAADGAAALHAALAERDPAMAARLKPGDGQRLARALEVVEATGLSLADFQAETAPPPRRRFRLVVLAPERAALNALIERRVESMWREGAAAEVEALLALGLPPDRPILKALGVAPLARALAGETTLAAAAEATIIATRQYAKRQRTWFTHQCATARLPSHVHGCHVVPEPDSAQQMESFAAKIVRMLS